jgi:hypothetical protein
VDLWSYPSALAEVHLGLGAAVERSGKALGRSMLTGDGPLLATSVMLTALYQWLEPVPCGWGGQLDGADGGQMRVGGLWSTCVNRH